MFQLSQADLFKAIMKANSWDTADVIPIARLKSALKIRNVDTVNEFFKSRSSCKYDNHFLLD